MTGEPQGVPCGSRLIVLRLLARFQNRINLQHVLAGRDDCRRLAFYPSQTDDRP